MISDTCCFFPRQALWPVLQDVAVLSDLVPDEPLQVIFPEGERSFPFEPFGRTPQQIRWDEPVFAFATSLEFPPDKVLRSYQRRMSRELEEDSAGLDDEERVRIGYIYVTVDTELPDVDAVLMEFSTPGSSISFLFRESTSIRKTFIHLLKTHHGICGVLDTEMQVEIFWWKGRRVKKIIYAGPEGTSDLTFCDFEKACTARV